MENNKNLAELFFLQQQFLCCKFLRAYTLNKNAEDLHQLRVTIKKIRAVLLMLRKLRSDFDYDKNFAPYKKIFKQVGPIREEFLQHNRIKKDTTNKLEKDSHRVLIIKLHKELKGAQSKHLKNIALVSPAILDSLRKLEQKEVYPYCRKILKRLKNKWDRLNTEKNFHQFRKHLKQFLYCSRLLSEKDKAKLISQKNYDRINELQELLGTWHDDILLLHNIEKDGLKVNPAFIHSLENETNDLMKAIAKKGSKL